MPTQKIKNFWEKTRAELDEVEMNASVEKVEDADVFTMEGGVKTRTIYRIIMSSLGRPPNSGLVHGAHWDTPSPWMAGNNGSAGLRRDNNPSFPSVPVRLRNPIPVP